MNVYYVTRCSHCGKATYPSEVGEIRVHSAEFLQEIEMRIAEGESIHEIAKDFCAWCYGRKPCGCDNPHSQQGLPWV